tara:strand:- start:1385 stop:2092 length:708 start_codon:yes stop_codon:yes gene_type:complete
MDLSIIIVSHGHEKFLSDLIESISKQLDSSRFEILLLHNLPSVYSSSVPIKTFNNHTPRGLAENLNLLIDKAQAPVSLILNPDTKLPNKCLVTCLENLKPNHILSCPAFSMDGRRLVNLRLFPTLKDILRERFLDPHARLRIQSKLELNPSNNCWLQGSFLMGNTEIFRKIAFDTNYKLYFEDVDFFRRCKMLEIPIQYIQKTYYIHHHCQASSKALSAEFWIHCRSAFRYFSGF